MSWNCPNCHEPLQARSGSLVCTNNHSFDVSREGYVNLLGGRKIAETVGDSEAMLVARRRFLEAGYYGRLREALIGTVGELNPKTLVDVGCGEGYYTAGIKAVLPMLRAYGTDVAKPAVRAAARSYPDIAWAVADTNVRLPLADGSVDIILNVFAPRNNAEFDRIVNPNGHVVVVIPAADHLHELRKGGEVIGIQEDKAASVATTLNSFKLVSSREVRITFELDAEARANLIGMTPSARHATAARHSDGALRAVTAHFEMLTFKRA